MGAKSEGIDLGLEVLAAVRRPQERFTADDIGEVCGCSGALIQQIERRALQRIRERLRRDWRLTYDEFANMRNFEA
jgi:hypothetical protein